MNIGMIGNFRVPYTTENDRKWSFEKLGHTVIAFQENEVDADRIKRFMPELDMLVYSHTHGWNIPGLKEVFAYYKQHGVPTVSVHLDRWAWLERVSDIGKEATWFTEYIFMADGSPEAVKLYEKHNLNWHYLAPGVVERDCKLLDRLTRHNYDVVFTGSKQYHPEYPFRKELVEFLQQTYGDNFGHFGNDGIAVLRGDDLNIMLAKSKVVVGDSCFGGRPYYVSDRYYETRGRGGFLIHPYTKGIDSIGVGHYDKGNLKSLKETIDYYLNNDAEREDLRMQGHNYVKQHETYTDRAKEILKVVFG